VNDMGAICGRCKVTSEKVGDTYTCPECGRVVALLKPMKKTMPMNEQEWTDTATIRRDAQAEIRRLFERIKQDVEW